MTEEEVLQVVVRNLADIAGVHEDALRVQLGDSGEEWPYDSIALAELLVTLEDELGFEVPMDSATARALRTVKGLVRRLAELMPKVDAA